MKRIVLYGGLIAGSALPAMAQTNVDTTVLYTGVATPFNAALAIAVGMIATLLVVKWVRRAMGH